MMHQREFELCAETLQACQAAAAGGADRVEVCAALQVGGVTPSRGFLRAAVALSSVPVHALLRPRAGDFVYTAAEFDLLCADLEDALAAGAAGVVCGILTGGGEIDRIRAGELIRRASGRPVTFHRAFDQTKNLPESLEVLAGLGYARVLTSGGRPTVMEGLPMLERLAVQAAGRLRVAAGGGVTLDNAPTLLRVPGLDLHASLLPKRPPPTSSSDPLWDLDAPRNHVSAHAVRALSALVHGQRPAG